MKMISVAIFGSLLATLAACSPSESPQIPVETTFPVAAQNSRGMHLYQRNCAACHGEQAEGAKAACAMRAGPSLLGAVKRMSATDFWNEVRHVGETNCCARHLLELSQEDVETIRRSLVDFATNPARAETGGTARPRAEPGS